MFMLSVIEDPHISAMDQALKKTGAFGRPFIVSAKGQQPWKCKLPETTRLVENFQYPGHGSFAWAPHDLLKHEIERGNGAIEALRPLLHAQTCCR